MITDSDCGNDTTRVVLQGSTKPLQPDLVAEQLDVVEGDPNTVRATERRGYVCQFSNQGRAPASTFETVVTRDGTPVDTLTYDSLDVNQRVRTDTVQVPFPDQGTSVVECSVDDDDQITERRENNNTVRRSIEVIEPPTPDLVAEQLEPVGPVPSPLRVSDTLRFVHSVSNQGSEEAGAFEAVVTRSGTPVDTITYEGGLEAGEESRLDTTAVRFESEGSTTIRYAADPDSTVDERGRIENNDRERTYDVAPPPAPDLEAERLEPAGPVPDPLRVSDTLRFVHSVSNQGSEEAGAFEAVVTRNGTPVDTIAYEGGLEAGEESRVDTTAVRFESEGSTTIRYAADPDSTVDERGRIENNDLERTFNVAPPPAPDLAAVDLRAVGGTPSDVRVADTLSVICEFENQGEEDVIDQSFSVRLTRGDKEIRSAEFSTLRVGSSRETEPIPVPFLEEGPVDVICELDPEERIDEEGRLDNNITVLPISVQRPETLPVRPNPFTPNGDGVNDEVRFKVDRFGLTQPVLRIFTFEGRRLRTIDQVQGGELRWDGTASGGARQPPGVYLYVVEDQGRTVASGHITLAR